MRRAARTDDNQKRIVEGLRKAGFSVRATHQVSDGFPDITVGANKKNFLFEIKDGNKVKSARKLTPDEVEFHSTWKGQITIIETVEQAIEYINSHK